MTRDETRRLIRQNAKGRQGLTARVSGSGHSWVRLLSTPAVQRASKHAYTAGQQMLSEHTCIDE